MARSKSSPSAPKTVSRVLTFSCGHVSASGCTYPPQLRTRGLEAMARWADAEFRFRSTQACSTCHATHSLPVIQASENVLVAEYGVSLPSFDAASLPMAVRARALRLKVIEGARTELHGPDTAESMLALVVLLAARPGPPGVDLDDRLALARRLHATRLMRDIAGHTDPRYWLLRTAQGARAYAHGAALARDLRYLFAALGTASTPWPTSEQADVAFQQMLTRPHRDDLDLFSAGFTEGLSLPQILEQRSFLRRAHPAACGANRPLVRWLESFTSMLRTAIGLHTWRRQKLAVFVYRRWQQRHPRIRTCGPPAHRSPQQRGLPVDKTPPKQR